MVSAAGLGDVAQAAENVLSKAAQVAEDDVGGQLHLVVPRQTRRDAGHVSLCQLRRDMGQLLNLHNTHTK